MIDHPVHPVADLFPMLPEDELAELAEDIKRNGLIHPIVLDDQGRILDGRNRWVACQHVGVEPAFAYYDGDEPAAYADSANLNRRHLTKSQRAMIAARAARIRGEYTRDVATEFDVSQPMAAKAAAVLDHAPDLADAVAAGEAPLDRAYETAQQRKAAAASEAAQLERLRAEAPDLAELVTAGTMQLAEAQAAAKQRAQDRTRDIESARRAAKTLVGEFQSAVATIVIGRRHGETGLVTDAMLADLRQAFELLEGAR